MHQPDNPDIASLMGYRGVVKPGDDSNRIVTQRLNAERGYLLTERGNGRSGEYLVETPTTQSGRLKGV